MSTAIDDTIVAVSSPPGRAMRGLVRLSGAGTQDVLERCGIHAPTPRCLSRVRIDVDGLRLPALCVTFVSPHSYTGQDMAELFVPGHPALLDRLVHAALHLGARHAEPGEFTFRGFLAGKHDLTQAEGIAATISAVSDAQLAAASHLRNGMLGQFAADAVNQLADVLALVEAGIDFTDQDDVVPIAPAALEQRLAALCRQIDTLLSRSRSWGAVESLPRVAFVGAPSTGKSTLFNALLGRRRAVISEIPGTTRDALMEPLRIELDGGGHAEVMLVDIAGLDTPAAVLDREAQSIAHGIIDRADLLLLISDDRPPATSLSGRNSIRVRTKADLIPTHAASLHADVVVSATTGIGLGELRRLIAARLVDRVAGGTEQGLTLQPRHEASLRSASLHLRQASELLRPSLVQHSLGHVELIADAMRTALTDLAALGGTMTPDDVIGRVFATFCVGK